MTSLMLSPHNDDCELFAAFHCLRERPHVIVVLKSRVQEERFGITAETREAETAAAMEILGCPWRQLSYLDTDPDWAEIGRMLAFFNESSRPDTVFAPAFEQDGHPHHNQVAKLADMVFGAASVTHYLTYTRAGKSRWGESVAYKPAWVEKKIAALACYRSQSSLANCAEHFLRGQHEYVAT